jgi:hypothetical protein
VSVLTPDTSLAHDADACRGWARLVRVSDEGRYYFLSESLCPDQWNVIAAAAALVRAQDGQFTLAGLLGLDLEWNDDYAGTSGNTALTTGRCYINVGVNSAYHHHPLPLPFGDNDFWMAVSLSTLRCT